MTTTRKILIAEAVLVLGIVAYMYFSMAPEAISPISGQSIFEPDFVLEIGNGEEVLVSRTPDFSNPIILKEGSEVDLPVGTYYWKVRNWLREGEINTFVIESNVGLNLREGSEQDLLENSGTVDVKVNEKKSGTITGVGVGESIEVEKGGEFEGKQDEN